MIVSLYKGKGQRTECMNYRAISLLNVVGKIYLFIYLLVSRGLRSMRYHIDVGGKVYAWRDLSRQSVK